MPYWYVFDVFDVFDILYDSKDFERYKMNEIKVMSDVLISFLKKINALFFLFGILLEVRTLGGDSARTVTSGMGSEPNRAQMNPFVHRECTAHAVACMNEPLAQNQPFWTWI